MGKYSSISANNLKFQVEKALNELENNQLINIKEGINQTSVLNSSARICMTNALNDVNSSNTILGSINILKKNLTSLKTACGKIESIQDLEKEIDEYEKEIANLKRRLYYTERYSETYTDPDGIAHTTWHTRQVLDTGVQSKIRELEQKKNGNKTKISDLEQQVDNILE